MSKLRLLIQQPGRANASLPVMVNGTERIGNCIPSLVNYLGFPRRDRLGRVLTYSLRPESESQPLSSILRFADVQLLPETRLVLEAGNAKAQTPPGSTPISRGSCVGVPIEEVPVALSHRIVNRRTFVAGSILVGCALGGLFTGMTTAFATSRSAFPLAMAPPATPSPQTLSAMLQQTFLFSGHQQMVRVVSWSPDGTTVASGADDGLLLLWTPDGQVQQRIPHPAGVAALAWSPSGRQLASGSENSVRFFDARTAALLAPARSVHMAQVTSLAWSGALGNPLVSGSLDMQAIVWETQDYLPRNVFSRHTTAIDALSCQAGKTTVASASQGGAVRVWGVDTLAEVHSFYQDAQLPMRTVAFAPMGNQLAVGGNDGQVRLWSDGLLCQQSSLTVQGRLCVDVPLRLHAHTAPVRSVSWSPDGHFFATGGEDGTFAIWAYRQGQLPVLLTKMIFADPVVAVAWSPVRGHIAVASGKTVTIWKVQM